MSSELGTYKTPERQGQNLALSFIWPCLSDSGLVFQVNALEPCKSFPFRSYVIRYNIPRGADSVGFHSFHGCRVGKDD